MTDLRALVGAGFLPAVMGFVVSVPLGWDLVLVAAEKVDLLDTNTATAEQLKPLSYWRGLHREDHQGRPYRWKEELVQEKILPRSAYEGIKYELMAKQKLLFVRGGPMMSSGTTETVPYQFIICDR